MNSELPSHAPEGAISNGTITIFSIVMPGGGMGYSFEVTGELTNLAIVGLLEAVKHEVLMGNDNQ